MLVEMQRCVAGHKHQRPVLRWSQGCRLLLHQASLIAVPSNVFPGRMWLWTQHCTQLG